MPREVIKPGQGRAPLLKKGGQNEKKQLQLFYSSDFVQKTKRLVAILVIALHIILLLLKLWPQERP
jgi:hypothetical protein